MTSEPLAPTGDVIRVFGVATIVALVVGATSGFSLIIAGIGISEIRSWNRVSIFIGFFALATVGFGIDWLRRRLPDRAWRMPVTVAALALLVLVGILDQVAPTVVPDYAADAAALRLRRSVLHQGRARRCRRARPSSTCRTSSSPSRGS